MIKVIDLKDIYLARINDKYITTKDGRLILTKKYRDFKKLVTMQCKKVRIDPPYNVKIIFHTACDIDSHIKPILDSMENAGVLTNDSKVISLTVEKISIKRGQMGSMTVFVETIKQA